VCWSFDYSFPAAAGPGTLPVPLSTLTGNDFSKTCLVVSQDISRKTAYSQL
jgi:hypothetical protein